MLAEGNGGLLGALAHPPCARPSPETITEATTCAADTGTLIESHRSLVLVVTRILKVRTLGAIGQKPESALRSFRTLSPGTLVHHSVASAVLCILRSQVCINLESRFRLPTT